MKILKIESTEQSPVWVFSVAPSPVSPPPLLHHLVVGKQLRAEPARQLSTQCIYGCLTVNLIRAPSRRSHQIPFRPSPLSFSPFLPPILKLKEKAHYCQSDCHQAVALLVIASSYYLWPKTYWGKMKNWCLEFSFARTLPNVPLFMTDQDWFYILVDRTRRSLIE